MASDPPETIVVQSARVACDGAKESDDALGHPKVYLQIGEEGAVECPYCDRRFVIDKTVGAAAY